MGSKWSLIIIEVKSYISSGIINTGICFANSVFILRKSCYKLTHHLSSIWGHPCVFSVKWRFQLVITLCEIIIFTYFCIFSKPYFRQSFFGGIQKKIFPSYKDTIYQHTKIFFSSCYKTSLFGHNSLFSILMAIW